MRSVGYQKEHHHPAKSSKGRGRIYDKPPGEGLSKTLYQMRKCRTQYEGPYQVAQGLSQAFIVIVRGNFHPHRIDTGKKKPSEKTQQEQAVIGISCPGHAQIEQPSQQGTNQENP